MVHAETIKKQTEQPEIGRYFVTNALVSCFEKISYMDATKSGTKISPLAAKFGSMTFFG